MFINFGERIILPLDRQFVIYPGGAGVDEGARVDKGEECPGVVYPGSCDVLIEKLIKFTGVPSSTPASSTLALV